MKSRRRLRGNSSQNDALPQTEPSGAPRPVSEARGVGEGVVGVGEEGGDTQRQEREMLQKREMLQNCHEGKWMAASLRFRTPVNPRARGGGCEATASPYPAYKDDWFRSNKRLTMLTKSLRQQGPFTFPCLCPPFRPLFFASSFVYLSASPFFIHVILFFSFSQNHIPKKSTIGPALNLSNTDTHTSK